MLRIQNRLHHKELLSFSSDTTMKGFVTTHSFLSLDVVRVRSTDSQEPVQRVNKANDEQTSSPFPKTSTPSLQQKSWRAGDQSSIFRSQSVQTSDIPDMFLIKRSLAFEDEEEA